MQGGIDLWGGNWPPISLLDIETLGVKGDNSQIVSMCFPNFSYVEVQNVLSDVLNTLYLYYFYNF